MLMVNAEGKNNLNVLSIIFFFSRQVDIDVFSINVCLDRIILLVKLT